MTQPLVAWDAENEKHPQLVWRGKLDNRYLIEVHRTDQYYGKLFVFDHDKNDQEIACWEVGLSYGAVFGPYIANIDDWQKKVLDFIDNTYGK